MKHLVLFIALCTTGCFAAQRDAIIEESNDHIRALDRQCRQNMTEWCRTQYMMVQRQREQELNDLEARRHHFAEIMVQTGQSMQQSMQHNQNSVTCQTTYIGNYAQTYCH